MIDDKYLALLHAELDGLNSPQASARLTAYLAANPEAQRFYEELRGMANTLAEVKPVEPPAHLQSAIMNALTRRHAPRVAKQSRLAAFKDWWEEIFETKYAFSFAGGLAVGIVLFALAVQLTTKERVSDSSKLYGTIGAPQTAERSAEFKSHSIQHEAAGGEIKWRREGDLLETEIALTATEAFDLVILFEAGALKCKGISSIDGSALPNAVLQAGRLQLAHAGERSYHLTFQLSKPAAPAMRVQFQRNGVVFYDEEIALTKIDEHNQ
jgi:hypothetical protein